MVFVLYFFSSLGLAPFSLDGGKTLFQPFLSLPPPPIPPLPSSLTFKELTYVACPTPQLIELQRYLSVLDEDDAAASKKVSDMEALVASRKFGEAVDLLVEQGGDLFGSSQASDGMIQNFFHLVVYLAQAAQILPRVLGRIVEVVSASSLGNPVVQLAVLNNVYNTLPEGLELKFDTLVAMVSLAAETDVLPAIKPHLLSFEELVKGAFADVDVGKKRAGLGIAASALSSVGARAEASALRIVLLNSYDGDASSSVSEVESVVVQVVADTLDMDGVYKFDHLLELDAVQAFQNHSNATYALVFQLLSVFVSGFLSEYTSLYDSSADAKNVVDNVLSLSHEKNVNKMRLLSLTSLAGNTEIIPYSLVAGTLQIDDADVEAWGIKINKAKLARVRMDQEKQVMHITRAEQRVFEQSHWELLKGKLEGWRDAVTAMSVVLDENKQQQ